MCAAEKPRMYKFLIAKFSQVTNFVTNHSVIPDTSYNVYYVKLLIDRVRGLIHRLRLLNALLTPEPQFHLSNRRTRICSPLHDHSATQPKIKKGKTMVSSPHGVWSGKWCPGPESNRHGSCLPRDFRTIYSFRCCALLKTHLWSGLYLCHSMA